MNTCWCRESHALRCLSRILYRQIIWFKENQYNEDLLYNESCIEITTLSKSQCFEILKILADNYEKLDVE